MKWTLSNPSTAIRRTAAAAALTLAVLLAVPTAGEARSNNSASPQSLEGTWLVEVTLYDCNSGTPIPPAFKSLVSFHRGGTISESPGALAFASGQRSAGHGNWDQLGHHSYSQNTIALILFDTAPNLPGPGFDPTKPITPGFFAGWQTINHTVQMNGPDRFTSTGTNAFYKTDGTLYRTGCSSAVGERYQ